MVLQTKAYKLNLLEKSLSVIKSSSATVGERLENRIIIE